jgi:hypothetical protein
MYVKPDKTGVPAVTRPDLIRLIRACFPHAAIIRFVSKGRLFLASHK